MDVLLDSTNLLNLLQLLNLAGLDHPLMSVRCHLKRGVADSVPLIVWGRERADFVVDLPALDV